MTNNLQLLRNIRAGLIKAGVSNLHEFGYPMVDGDNILTEYVFASMFKSMLEENKGKGSKSVDREIDTLLVEVQATIDKGIK